MRSIISILNHKGGVGKSTISTNLAGYYANRGANVLLGDFDIHQLSSKNWLALRPQNASKIISWDWDNGKMAPISSDIHRVIIDGPAGIKGKYLERLVSISDKIIVPLKPSFFDMASTTQFVDELVQIVKHEKTNKNRNVSIGLIGNMVEMRTKSLEQLLVFIEKIIQQYPMIARPTNIRNSQAYGHLVSNGLSLFDTRTKVFSDEINQYWKPLINWLERSST